MRCAYQNELLHDEAYGPWDEFVCDPLGLAEYELLTFNVIPNPVSQEIQLPNSENFDEYLILDFNGRIVKRDVINNSKREGIGVSQLAPGVYHIHLMDQKKVIVGKFVKF